MPLRMDLQKGSWGTKRDRKLAGGTGSGGDGFLSLSKCSINRGEGIPFLLASLCLRCVVCQLFGWRTEVRDSLGISGGVVGFTDFFRRCFDVF